LGLSPHPPRHGLQLLLSRTLPAWYSSPLLQDETCHVRRRGETKDDDTPSPDFYAQSRDHPLPPVEYHPLLPEGDEASKRLSYASLRQQDHYTDPSNMTRVDLEQQRAQVLQRMKMSGSSTRWGAMSAAYLGGGVSASDIRPVIVSQQVK
jgi:hypothetical protein